MKLKERIKEVAIDIIIIMLISTEATILMFIPSWLDEAVLMPLYPIIHIVIVAFMISVLVFDSKAPREKIQKKIEEARRALLLTILVFTIPLMLLIKTILFPQKLSLGFQDIIYLNVGTLINVLIMGFFISRTCN